MSGKPRPRSLADAIATRTLPEERISAIRKMYVDGHFGRIFPSGSRRRPELMVGRTAQIGRLSVLHDDLLHAAPGEDSGLVGVVLHGPRGTGKTALLDAFEDAFQSGGGFVARMAGNDDLTTLQEATAALLRGLAEGAARARSYKAGGSASLDVPDWGQITVGGNLESKPQDARESAEQPSITTVLHAALSGDELKGAPLLVSVDEAHGADPNVMGRLLNAVQRLGGSAGFRVGIALAGTPDVLDVLRDRNCRATWFLDRAGTAKRLVPMPNDLPEKGSYLAVKATLKAAEVSILDEGDYAAAIVGCKGSPYFLQVLGERALASASRNGDVADFAPGGEIDEAFRQEVLSRYEQTWEGLDAQGLSGCARQLGALWRIRGQDGPQAGITPSLVRAAIRSGLECAPKDVGPPVPLSAHQAASHFKRLGLLWSVGGGASGPWSLGLPSFFDYVEAEFQDEENLEHHQSLPRLKAAMAPLLNRRPKMAGTPGSPVSP